MKRLVIFSGAGISAESGIRTFRGADGLWEDHRIEDVASPDAWIRDSELVLRFYNERRKQVIAATPNEAHYACVELEKLFLVDIITQNIDDLHERAGSSRVLHLHGEIRKSQSTVNPKRTYSIEGAYLSIGDCDSYGHQLRPHVVWFGEEVPNMEAAINLCAAADVLVIVGSSLQVYPAAGLIQYRKRDCKLIVIDPDPNLRLSSELLFLNEVASTGMRKLVDLLQAEA